MIPAQRPDAVQPSSDRPWLIALGAGLLLAVALSAGVAAAEPSPLLIDPLDPRAEGEGPGLVGDPLLAALVVLVLGVVAAAAAAAYTRLSQRR